MARRSSGLSGFIEQEQPLSNVIVSEDASKCYSFPSALIISEVCDMNNCFLFLQDCRPLHHSSLRFCSTFAIVTVLCKGNANEFRRHFADSNEISPKIRQHLPKVPTGENFP